MTDSRLSATWWRAASSTVVSGRIGPSRWTCVSALGSASSGVGWRGAVLRGSDGVLMLGLTFLVRECDALRLRVSLLGQLRAAGVDPGSHPVGADVGGRR